MARRGARDRDGPVLLYGWHTVKAALENPARRFHRLLATENAARRLAEDGVTFPLAPALVRPDDIAAIAGAEAVHQGLSAAADPLPSPELEDDRHRRHRAGARPNHRSAQCGGDPAFGGRRSP